MTLTTLDLLNAVEAAILAILQGAQSYAVGEQRFTRANLPDLMNLRRELIIQNAIESDHAGGLTARAAFERPA